MHPDDVRVRDGDFEVVATFPAHYNGECTISNAHRIKKGDRIGRVRQINNPILPVPGYACASCVKVLPRAPKE